VWDICPRGRAAQQLSSYLQHHAPDFTHQGAPITPERLPVVAINAVASQAFMMSQRHRQALQQQRGVELWHFEQQRGEAVFIPGGCPHQVRNLASCCKVRPAALRSAVRFKLICFRLQQQACLGWSNRLAVLFFLWRWDGQLLQGEA
jgi:hypothetical protein